MQNTIKLNSIFHIIVVFVSLKSIAMYLHLLSTLIALNLCISKLIKTFRRVFSPFVNIPCPEGGSYYGGTCTIILHKYGRTPSYASTS